MTTEMIDQQPLEQEYAFFRKNVDSWLGSHQGEYVVIKGHNYLEFFETLSDALRSGDRNFGAQPYFVSQVREPRVHYVSALIKLENA